MTIANDNAPGLRTEGAAQKVSSTLAHQSTANAPREVAFHTGVYCHVAYSAIADEWIDELWSVVVHCPFCGADHRHGYAHHHSTYYRPALCGRGEYAIREPIDGYEAVFEERP